MPLYKSSNRSFWTLQCVINEVEPAKQKKYMIFAGLYCGLEKPNMNFNYMKPFIKKLKSVESEGMQWYNKCRKAHQCMYVVPLACACDSPTRAMVLNCKQYNGKYGCSFCLHPGPCFMKLYKCDKSTILQVTDDNFTSDRRQFYK